MRARRVLPLVFTLGALALLASAAGCGLGVGQRVSPPDDARYCQRRYALDDGRVSVCASHPLEASVLSRLERQLDEALALYPRFATACGIPLEGPPPSLTLHVVRYEELNDRVAFPRDEHVGNILGRYYVGRRAVFITERALDDGGAIHLPHELAHWLQDHAGITDPDEDERLARAFHRFYRARTRPRPPVAELTLSRAYGSGEPPGASDHDGDAAASARSLMERTDATAPPELDDLCGRAPAGRPR